MGSVDLLSDDGKIEVLQHILHQFRSSGVAPEAVDKIFLELENLRKPSWSSLGGSKGTIMELRESLARCIERHSIKSCGANAIEVNLSGRSRADFIKEVAFLVADLHHRQYVPPPLLQAWISDPGFTAPVEEGASPIRVEVNMTESRLKNEAEQRALGFNKVSLADLAVAHAAHYLLHNSDLFDGNTVRCNSTHSLKFFDESGLGCATWTLSRANWMTASRYL
jgi:hypothetical protein